MSVCVFVWKTTAWDSLGHAAMFNFFDVADRKTYISWWPRGQVFDAAKAAWTDDAYVAWGTKGTPQRTFAQDQSAEGEGGAKRRPDLAVVIAGLDEDAIQEYWLTLLRKDASWRARSLNCASVVYRALRAGLGGHGPVSKEDPMTPLKVYHFAERVRVHQRKKAGR